MSEVKRYTMVGPDWEAAPDATGKWVRASDYDAAQVELAALREELAGWKNLVGAVCATIPLAETLKASETQPSMVQYFKGLHAERDNLKKYLTAAEQRNANTVQKIETALTMLDDDDRGNNFRRILQVVIDTLKPTESGASE